MNKEETQMMAFQLIGFAGDAFSHFFQAIDAAKKADYEEAERLIQEGKKSMKEAHDAQTDLLSAEADGKDLAYSILMVHAQDHLTMALMYERLASEFISVYKEMNELKGKLINESRVFMGQCYCRLSVRGRLEGRRQRPF